MVNTCPERSEEILLGCYSSQIAVMRKMIIIAHSLYKNNQKYSADVYKKACGVL